MYVQGGLRAVSQALVRTPLLSRILRQRWDRSEKDGVLTAESGP